MRGNKAYKAIIKERLTILMVLIFCFLVSSSEYLLMSPSEDCPTEQENASTESSDDDATFLHNAVDAVVPFVVIVLDQALHLIAEIIGFDRQALSAYKGFLSFQNQLFEVLFEHIVATNAP